MTFIRIYKQDGRYYLVGLRIKITFLTLKFTTNLPKKNCTWLLRQKIGKSILWVWGKVNVFYNVVGVLDFAPESALNLHKANQNIAPIILDQKEVPHFLITRIITAGLWKKQLSGLHKSSWRRERRNESNKTAHPPLNKLH